MANIDELAASVAARLIARKETVAVVESSGGGLISAALLALPGASRYFLGGAVVYTTASREALLGIGATEMAGLRSASEPYAALLARTLRIRVGADWGLAETGAAGPTGNRYGDAAGHTCLAVEAVIAERTLSDVRTLETGSSDRTGNMRLFACAALSLLDEMLTQA